MMKRINESNENVFATSRGIELAYAENLYQNPATLLPLIKSGYQLAMSNFSWVNRPSYIAVADGAVITNIMCLLAEAFRRYRNRVPFIAITGKHANPCGMAIDWKSPYRAILKSLIGNRVAIMGGEVVVNFHIDDQLGDLLYEVPKDIAEKKDQKWGLDLILAPSFSDKPIEVLGKREKRRLGSNQTLKDPKLPTDEHVYRFLPGEVLRQKAPNFILTPDTFTHWTGRYLTGAEFETLLIAWAAAWRASSNTVALAKDRMLIGLGAGQQDRIECVRLCLSRARGAGHVVNDSLFASDAFFPFATSNPRADIAALAQKMVKLSVATTSMRKQIFDAANAILAVDNREGPEILADAGCIGGVVPAAGNNLEEVKNFFKVRQMSVGFVAPEHRGFSKH